MHISQEGNLTTLINVFETRPEQQQVLLDELSRFASSVIKEEPACLGAALHRSADGLRVVNYAQWRSQEDLDRFVKKYREQMQAQLQLAERANAHVYQVAYLGESVGR
ncbi:MAG: antibiotic biosynthesis monooxygenase family protein [Ktedonobacteraceae bacterium]